MAIMACEYLVTSLSNDMSARISDHPRLFLVGTIRPASCQRTLNRSDKIRGHQLLYHKGIRSEAKRLVSNLRPVITRHYNNGRIGQTSSQAWQGFQTTYVWHVNVQRDYVWRKSCGLFESLLPVRRGAHNVKAGGAHYSSKGATRDCVVVNQQYSCALHRNQRAPARTET
jgi:hypothetical protein